MPQSREILVLRGRLDRAGRYTPGRSRSTPQVREWPVVEDGAFVVVAEILDSAERVLHRERARVRPDIGCQPGDPQSYRVLAYIQLRDDATTVRLLRDDLQLWRAMIPAAPTLEVTLSRVRDAREKPLILRLRYSKPGDHAHVIVVYKWGDRRFRTIYVGRPSPQLEIDLRALPGGPQCLLAVSYSNGLRSAHTATDPFRVPSLPPRVSVIRPDAKTRLFAKTAVILEGAVFDPERAGGPSAENLIWLIDGKEVATGLIASVDGLAAGRHKVTLAYPGPRGTESSTTVIVRESSTPTAEDWPEWDPISGNN